MSASGSVTPKESSAEPLAGMMVGVTWPSARGTKAVPARKSKPTSERACACERSVTNMGQDEQ